MKLKDWMSNSVDPDETAHMSRLIWIYSVCKSLLLSPVAVKELSKVRFGSTGYNYKTHRVIEFLAEFYFRPLFP